MLQMLFILFFISEMCNSDYNITVYNNPIIKERYGNSYLYNTIWRTLHFIDILELYNQTLLLSKHNNNLMYKCQSFEQCNYLYVLKNLQTIIDNLNNRVSTLLILTSKSRNKRGLMNFVGSGLKYLFGTMNDADATLISETIDNIYNHSSNTVLLLKTETTLVKNMVLNFTNFQNQYNSDIAKLNNFTKDINLLITRENFNNLVLENIFHLKFNLEHANTFIEHIENSLQSDKTNFISPYLVTPHNLIKSMEKLTVSTGKTSIFDIKIENYHLFMKLSDIQLFLHNNKLVYKISTPIPNVIEYDIVKLSAIPVSGYTKYWIYANLLETYIAVSRDKLEYINIDIKNCKL